VHVVTPVSQAAALQDGLRRAMIEPCAWVVNKSLLASGTHAPLLRARSEGELRQMARLSGGLAKRVFAVPWLAQAPVGFEGLAKLLGAPQA
jgi:arsenite-transporting ATPase